MKQLVEKHQSVHNVTVNQNEDTDDYFDEDEPASRDPLVIFVIVMLAVLLLLLLMVCACIYVVIQVLF